jgi:4-coumarate--CoA ligase
VTILLQNVTNFLLFSPIATDNYNLRTLKTLYSGAAPLGGPLVTAVKQKLKSVGADVVVCQGPYHFSPVYAHGSCVVIGYGLTETSPITHLLLPYHSEKVGSIGWLLPNLNARLVDEKEDGTVVDVAVGEPGEVWIKGASVMKVRFPRHNPNRSREMERSISPGIHQ